MVIGSVLCPVCLVSELVFAFIHHRQYTNITACDHRHLILSCHSFDLQHINVMIN